MKISDRGVDLIKKWEGLRLKAYKCPANVWTIGYGHTKTAQPGQVIDEAEAERLLREDLKSFEWYVTNQVDVRLNQNQYDALVSFMFNVGPRNFGRSTLLKELNKGKYTAAGEQFKRWIYAGGRVLNGLINRREDEYNLFIEEVKDAN